MKKKNEIEQELDQKEFENELDRDLSHQYQKIKVHEKLLEGKNPYVIGMINFFGTLFFTLGVYLALKFLYIRVSMGFLSKAFILIDPVVYIGSFGLSVVAVIKKKSPLDTFLDRVSQF